MTQQHLGNFIGSLRTALHAAAAAATEPLAMACEVGGEVIDAETREDRALLTYDSLQADVVYALLRSAVDIDKLLNYIQFAAADIKQAHEPTAAAVAAGALPGALTEPGISVCWGIHPDVWFANNPAICWADKQTL